MNKDWIDVLREKLLNYEEPVPDGLWERIEASLEARDMARRKTRTLVWSLAAAAAVALGVFAGVNLIDRTPGFDDHVVADSQDHRTEPSINPSSSADFKDGSVIPADPVTTVRNKASELVAVVTPEEIPEVAVPEIVREIVSGTSSEAVPEVVGNDEANEDLKDDHQFLTDHDGEDWSGYSSATNDGVWDKLGKVVAGLSLTSTAQNSQYVNTVESSMFFMGLSPIAASAEEGASFLPSSYDTKAQVFRISAFNYAANTRADSEPVTKDENHRRPIRAALNLSYPLNERLWIESGLTYSMLHSTFTTSSGTTVTEDNQSLGYLGVPLNLRMNLFGKDIVTVYATGGGMVEKFVHGGVKTSILVSGNPRGESTYRKLHIKPLQWSMNASAGIQANIMDSFGIYAEPGISYHFASNANVRSIYTEQPLDFIMTFGARFAFR